LSTEFGDQEIFTRTPSREVVTGFIASGVEAAAISP
jgi:hypothetical protein